MKQQDSLGFVQRFELAPDQEKLDGKGYDEKNVVAGKAEKTVSGDDEDRKKEQAREDSRSGLLYAEIDELHQEAFYALQLAPGPHVAEKSVDRR